MRMRIRAFLAVVLALTGTVDPLLAQTLSYRIGPGDELAVSLPLDGNTDDLRGLAGNGLSLLVIGNVVYWRYTTTVAPDGSIVLPSLPKLMVAGLSAEELEQMIRRQMPASKRGRQVTVEITRYNSLAYFVWGEVHQPGRFLYQRPISILEAVGGAGGATDKARMSKVLLLRTGRPVSKLDLSPNDVASKNFSDPIQPGDTIIVSRKPFADSMTWLFLVTAIASATAGIYAASK